MKILVTGVLISGLFAAAAFAAPSIQSVANAASLAQVPMPNSAVAQGAFFSIFGAGLGPGTSDCGAGFVDCIWKPFPLPASIKGVSVTVTVGQSAPVNAYIYFVYETQINAIMPSNTPVGSGQITVTFNGQTSAPAPIVVAASSFGAFTLNQAGSGPGIFQNIDPITKLPSTNTFFNTAKPGQYITIYGTGLGAPADLANEATKDPVFPDDFTAAPHNLSVKVWVGNQPATVAYAGRSQYTGLDQINFIVPAASSVQGCLVQVAVELTPLGGTPVISNFSSLAVDPNGATCRDINGLNMADLSKATENIGIIGLQSAYANITFGGDPPYLPWVYDTATAAFGTIANSSLLHFQGVGSIPSLNNCSVTPFLQFPPPIDPAVSSWTALDAGPGLQIVGPNGTATLSKNTNGGAYSGFLGGRGIGDATIVGLDSETPSFFLLSTRNADKTYTINGIAPGTYTVTGSGAAVGQFTTTFTVSPGAAAFQWTNPAAINTSSPTNPLGRDQPITVNWTGGDPTGFVNITLIGSAPKGTTPDVNTPGVIAQCIAKASTGAFTIPEFVLRSMPAPSDTLSGSPLAGMVLLGPVSAPMKVSPAPSGLDAAYLYYNFLQGYTVYWR